MKFFLNDFFSLLQGRSILLVVFVFTLQRQVLQRAVTATLRKHEEISQRDKLVYKPHS